MNHALNTACRAIALLLLALPGWADEKPVFEVQTARFNLQESLLVLDSRISIDLHNYALSCTDYARVFCLAGNLLVSVYTVIQPC